MQVTVVPAGELNAGQLQRWGEIQRSDGSLASPFFCPEFTLAAASVFRDVRVAVIEQDGKVVGFFPFQRRWPKVCKPVADLMSDYQGVVIPKDVRWDARDLLRSCGASSFKFNHLIASQEQFHPYHCRCALSPAIDLRNGFDAYRQERIAAGSKLFKQIEGLARQCAREVGPVRFEYNVPDRVLLDRVIDLKLQHLASSGQQNVLQLGWSRGFLQRILESQLESFAGMLSVLYVGDEIAAAHMGMRSHSVWHYWVTTYDERFYKYSPGLILLMRMAEKGPEQGLERIDLGKGEAAYKQRFMNSSTILAEGEVVVSSFSLSRAVIVSLRRTKAVLDHTPLRKVAWAIYRSCIHGAGGPPPNSRMSD